jgi:regulatory protein
VNASLIEIDTKDIRLAAMDLLARREHSRLELEQKLRKRFSDQLETIESELDKLAAEGLQSDERLAEAFIRARSSRGQGPSKIRMELKGKGLADEAISLAFEVAEVDWYELVQAVAQKKFGEQLDNGPDLKLKAKVSRFLQGRGFSYDHISSLF